MLCRQRAPLNRGAASSHEPRHRALPRSGFVQRPLQAASAVGTTRPFALCSRARRFSSRSQAAKVDFFPSSAGPRLEPWCVHHHFKHLAASLLLPKDEKAAG